MAARRPRRSSILKTRQSIGIGDGDGGSGEINVGFVDRKVTEGGSELPRISRRVSFSHTNEIKEYEKSNSSTEGSFSKTQDFGQTMCDVYNMSICEDRENFPDWNQSINVFGMEGDSKGRNANQTRLDLSGMSICEPEATEIDNGGDGGSGDHVGFVDRKVTEGGSELSRTSRRVSFSHTNEIKEYEKSNSLVERTFSKTQDFGQTMCEVYNMSICGDREKFPDWKQSRNETGLEGDSKSVIANQTRHEASAMSICEPDGRESFSHTNEIKGYEKSNLPTEEPFSKTQDFTQTIYEVNNMSICGDREKFPDWQQSINVTGLDGNFKSLNANQTRHEACAMSMCEPERRESFSRTNEIKEYEKSNLPTEGPFSKTQDFTKTMCEVHTMSICGDRENFIDGEQSANMIEMEADSKCLNANQTRRHAYGMSICEPEATEKEQEVDFQNENKTMMDKVVTRGARIPTLAEPRGRMHFIKPAPSMFRDPFLKQKKKMEPEKFFGVFGCVKTPKRNKIPKQNEYKITPTNSPETETEMPKDFEVAESTLERAGKKISSTDHTKDPFDIDGKKEFEVAGLAPSSTHTTSTKNVKEIPKDFKVAEPRPERVERKINSFDNTKDPSESFREKEFEIQRAVTSSAHNTSTRTDREIPKDFKVAEPAPDRVGKRISTFDQSKVPLDINGEKELDTTGVAAFLAHTTCEETLEELRKDFEVAEPELGRSGKEMSSFDHTKDPYNSYGDNEFEVTGLAISSTHTTPTKTDAEVPKDFEVAGPELGRSRKEINSFDHTKDKDPFDSYVEKEFEITGVAISSTHTTPTKTDEVPKDFTVPTNSTDTKEELPKDFKEAEPRLEMTEKKINSSKADPSNNHEEKEFEVREVATSSTLTTSTKPKQKIPKNVEAAEPRLDSAGKTINALDHVKHPFDSHGEMEFEVREVAMSSTLSSFTKTAKEIRKDIKVAEPGRERVERNINSFDNTKKASESVREEEFEITGVAISSAHTSFTETVAEKPKDFKVAEPELRKSRNEVNSFDRTKDPFHSYEQKEFEETGAATSSAHTVFTETVAKIPKNFEVVKSGMETVGKKISSTDHNKGTFDSYREKEFEVTGGGIPSTHTTSTKTVKEVPKDVGVAEPGIERTGEKINAFYRNKDPLDIYGELEFLHSLQHDLLPLSEEAWMAVQMQFVELIGKEYCTAITTKRNRLTRDRWLTKENE